MLAYLFTYITATFVFIPDFYAFLRSGSNCKIIGPCFHKNIYLL